MFIYLLSVRYQAQNLFFFFHIENPHKVFLANTTAFVSLKIQRLFDSHNGKLHLMFSIFFFLNTKPYSVLSHTKGNKTGDWCTFHIVLY